MKVRAFCEGTDKVTIKYYNGINNDPKCLRPYGATALVPSPGTYTSGVCKNEGTKSVKYTIVKNEESVFFTGNAVQLAGRGVIIASTIAMALYSAIF